MKTSKGEQKIIDILKNEGIPFYREFSPKGLVSPKGRPLRFDFLLKGSYSDVIIEFDGEQHFKRVTKFHKTLSDFKYEQERDLRKNQWCLMNGHTLYRIPYTDINKIHTLRDLMRPEYRVLNKYHNHTLARQIQAH